MLKINLYKWTAIFSCCYLILALNPFLLWLTWPPLINIPSYISVFACGLLLLSRNKIEVSRERLLLSVLLFLFAFHINLPITSPYTDYGRALSFLVFLFVLYFPKEILIWTLQYFIRFHKFICAASVIIFCFAAFIDLPHIQITNRTAILEDTEYYYKLYGFIVSSTNTTYNIGGLSIARICGIYPEPGHFATYISFIAIAQRLLNNRISSIFYIAGALTFSPVFYLTLLMLVVYTVVIKKSEKSIRSYFIYMLLSISVILLIGNSFKEQIWELAFGRNLTGGIESRLDERTDEIVLSAFQSFVETPDIWVGKGVTYVEELGIFSDFRGFVFKYGIIGLILSVLILAVLILKSKSTHYMMLLIPFAFLVFFQRSWMFGSIYVYMMFFLLLIFYRYVEEQKKLQNYRND